MKSKFQQISIALKKKRGNRGIRETAKEIGISPSTLSRVENGKLPDLESFTKICSWLEIDPGELLGCKKSEEDKSSKITSFHLKAEKNLSKKASKALADMILAAQNLFYE